jgi:cytochrome oxidase Cu insertion factor (SCO1/SenC/PrrC family)
MKTNEHRTFLPWQHLGSLPKSPLWNLVGLALAGILVMGVWTAEAGAARVRGSKDALQPLWKAPDFALIERSGRLLTKADLLGKVWIANFIFTRCVDTCPLGSNRMAQLQKTFAAEEDVRLVSITVDPTHDTPPVLARYAEKIGAHPQRWFFLTGNKDQIYRLAREGFRMGVKDPNDDGRSSMVPVLLRIRQLAQHLLQGFAPAVALAHHSSLHQDDTTRAIQHSERFVLVDRQGQVRHYYPSSNEAALRQVQRHVHRLLAEP